MQVIHNKCAEIIPSKILPHLPQINELIPLLASINSYSYLVQCCRVISRPSVRDVLLIQIILVFYIRLCYTILNEIFAVSRVNGIQPYQSNCCSVIGCGMVFLQRIAISTVDESIIACNDCVKAAFNIFSQWAPFKRVLVCMCIYVHICV